MKRILAAATLCFGLSFAQASTVSWSAVGANQIGSANGTAGLDGWLVRVGAFDISTALIVANANNLNYLNSHFIEFGSGTIGNTGLTSGDIGAWEATSTGNTSDLGPSHLNIEGSSIYIWTFNANTFGSATEHALFSSSLSHWTFPDQAGIPNTTAVDLGDLTNGAGTSLLGSAQLLAGNFSSDPAAGGGYLFLMAAVPEPSTTLLLGGPLVLCCLRRRR